MATMSGHDQFLDIVEQITGADRERAERAAHAVLQTLAERIDRGEARDLAAALPPELAGRLTKAAPSAEGFGIDDFLGRVAQRADLDPADAQRWARAVFVAIERTVPRKEFADMEAQLPNEFAPLLGEQHGRYVRVPPVEEILAKVAERAQLDPEGARRATEVVLETLAERIAGGEVEDLIAVLPPELHEPLRRGREHSGDNAQRMSLEGFLRRIAEREALDPPALARRHASAVFETLREELPPEEFLDVTAELPAEYAAVGARP
jgi:uncharacterized protein (DUF2267 family)